MRSRIMFVVAIVLALLLGATVAWASIPGPDGVIHGCRKNTDGSLRAIDSAATCPTGYTALNWSQTGPQGPAGPAGQDGVSGYEVVQQNNLSGFTATVTCPIGKKAVSGGVHWNGLGTYPIESFSMVGSYPTADTTGWVLEYRLTVSTVNVYAVCELAA